MNKTIKIPSILSQIKNAQGTLILFQSCKSSDVLHAKKKYARLREPSNIADFADTLKKAAARSSRVTQDHHVKFKGKRRFEKSADSRITWTW